jgi:D-alanyl-D-alanine carboxypeptidase
MMNKLFSVVFVFLLIVVTGCCSEDADTKELNLFKKGVVTIKDPQLMCDAVCVVDVATGRILYEKNSERQIPPASMTKLMTSRVVLEAVQRGEISLSDTAVISSASDFRSMPEDSSLMFLEEGHTVTYRELLQGLAIPSGNDAAVAVAENLCGSVEAFVEEMNFTAYRMGLDRTMFVEPSGYSPENLTTASEYAKFCRAFVRDFPEQLELYYGIKTFSYPKPHNGEGKYGKITQNNHNELIVAGFPGVTGLKTGFIDASGYNLALSVERDGFEIVAVIMGCHSYNNDYKNGSEVRALTGASLVTYIYSVYTLVDLSEIYCEKISADDNRSLFLMPEKGSFVALSLKEASALKIKFEGFVEGSSCSGEFVCFSGGQELVRFPAKVVEFPAGREVADFFQN